MRKSGKNRDQTVADEIAENENETSENVAGATDEAGEAEEVGAEVSELDQVSAERDEYLEQLLRSRAEFANFRKRTEQERLKLGEIFTANTLAQFLPVLDDFDRALAMVPENDRDSGWVSGITMIQKKLEGILERAGVQTIDALNTQFDPSMHEAVATEPGSTGHAVVEVYQKGYKLGDTLLRAAMVKTGDLAAGTDEETGQERFDA